MKSRNSQIAGDIIAAILAALAIFINFIDRSTVIRSKTLEDAHAKLIKREE